MGSGWPPKLDEANIYMCEGNCYGQQVPKRPGLEDSGGMVQMGSELYNALEEII